MSWANLKPTKEYDPPPLTQANWYVTGKPGAGKTNLIASIPRCLIIDFEGGGAMVRESEAERIALPGVKPWETMVKILVELRNDGAKGKDRRYDMVAIDSLDRWVASECDRFLQLRNEACPPQGRVELFADLPDAETNWGRAIGKVNSRVTAILALLTELRYGWIVVGHLMYQEQVKDGKTVVVPRPILGGKLPGTIMARSDFCAEVVRTPRVAKSVKDAAKGGGLGLVYKLSCKVSAANKDGKARLAGMAGWSAELPATKAWASVVEPAYAEAIK